MMPSDKLDIASIEIGGQVGGLLRQEAIASQNIIETPMRSSGRSFFHVLDHPNFQAPNTALGSLQAGTVMGVQYARSITLGLRLVFYVHLSGRPK